MVNVKTRTVKGYKGLDIPFRTLSRSDDANSLAIILPGAGYTTQAPLLHYSTRVFCINRLMFCKLIINTMTKSMMISPWRN